MDIMQKMEKMMRELADREDETPRAPLQRLRDLCYRVSQCLDAPADCPIDKRQDEIENLYSAAQKEIAHYEDLMAQACAQVEESAELPECVRKIKVAMTEDIYCGYQWFREGYFQLAAGLCSGEAWRCTEAEQCGVQGDELIKMVHEAIEKINREVPVLI